MHKTAFSARYQHVLSFLHWGHYFLEFSVKCASLYKTEVFSTTAARFVIFALSALLLSDFQRSALVCTKQPFEPKISTFCHFCTRCTTFSRFSAAFSARYQHVFSFLHWGHHFFEFSVKCTSLYKTEVFRPRSERFVLFALGTPLFSDFQQSARFVQNSVFSPISARFLILAPGTPLLRVFSKVHEFVQNSSFQPEIRTFCSFRTGYTTS